MAIEDYYRAGGLLDEEATAQPEDELSYADIVGGDSTLEEAAASAPVESYRRGRYPAAEELAAEQPDTLAGKAWHGYETLMSYIGKPAELISEGVGKVLGKEAFGDLGPAGTEIQNLGRKAGDLSIKAPIAFAGSLIDRIADRDVDTGPMLPDVPDSIAELDEAERKAGEMSPTLGEAVRVARGLGRGAGGATARVVADPTNLLPFAKAPKLARSFSGIIAPGMLKGIYDQGAAAIEEAKAGRYGAAAESAVGLTVDSYFAYKVAQHLMNGETVESAREKAKRDTDPDASLEDADLSDLDGISLDNVMSELSNRQHGADDEMLRQALEGQVAAGTITQEVADSTLQSVANERAAASRPPAPTPVPVAATAPAAAPGEAPVVPPPAAQPQPGDGSVVPPVAVDQADGAGAPAAEAIAPVAGQPPPVVYKAPPKGTKIAVNPGLQALVDQFAASGKPLTKADLVAAGMVTPRQARRLSMHEILQAAGGDTNLLNRVKAGGQRGYSVSAAEGLPSDGLSVEPVAPTPAVEEAAVVPPPVAGVEQPPLTPVVEEPAPTAPAEAPPPVEAATPTPAELAASEGQKGGPSKLTREWIQSQIDANPGVREDLLTSLQQIAQRHGLKALTQLTPVHLRDTLPGLENANSRALLNHVLHQEKAGAKKAPTKPVVKPAADEGGADPAFTVRDEDGRVVSDEATAHFVDYEDRKAKVPVLDRRGQMGFVERDLREPVMREVHPVDDHLLKAVTGKTRETATDSDLDAYFSSIEKNPHLKDPALLKMLESINTTSDPVDYGEKFAHVQPAIERLIGRRRGGKTEEGFNYEPDSPAGRIMASLRRRNLSHLEDRLQDAVTKMTTQLAGNDSDILTNAREHMKSEGLKGAQKFEQAKAAGATEEQLALLDTVTERRIASIEKKAQDEYQRARRLRELTTGPDETVNADGKVISARDQLTKMIGSWMKKAQLGDYRADKRRFNRLIDTRFGQEGDNAALDATHLGSDDMTRADLADLGPEYFEREGVDLGSPLAEGLSDVDAARFTPNDLFDRIKKRVASRNVEAQLPVRPVDTTPEDWVKAVREDPDLRNTVAESLLELKRRMDAGEGRSGADRAKGADYLGALRKFADDLGIPATASTRFNRLFNRVTRVVQHGKYGEYKPGGVGGGGEVDAAAPLYSDSYAASRSAAWSAAEAQARDLTDTGARIVDFEGGNEALATDLTDASVGGLLDRLSSFTNDLASILGLPTRFGGFVVSPALEGLRMRESGSAYVNPLQARFAAQREMVKTGATTESNPQALDYLTARNIVDTMTHEIAHRAARHSAANGDVEFREAYASAIEELSHSRGHYIEQVQRELRDAGPRLDSLAPDYDAAYKRFEEARNGKRTAEGGVVGAGASRPATAEPGPGGDQGGVGGGGRSGARPIRPIPLRGEEQAGRVRPGATAVGGAAEVADAGRARGVDGGDGQPGGRGDPVEFGERDPRVEGDESDPAFVSPAAAGPQRQNQGPMTEAQRRHRDEAHRVIGNFTDTYLRLFGETDPAAAGEMMSALAKASKMTPQERADLIDESGPQKKKDIGYNLRYVEGLNDTTKAALSIVLAAKRQTLSRDHPVTWDKVDAEMRDILGTHSKEEWARIAQQGGLKTAADYAALRTVVATFEEGIQAAHADLQAARVRGDQAGIDQALDEVALAVTKSNAARATLMGLPGQKSGLTNTARIMQAQQMIVRGMTPEADFKGTMKAALKAARVPTEQADAIYTMYRDTMAAGPLGDWAALSRAMSKATNPTMFQKVLELWKAGLLTIPSNVANVASNSAVLPYRFAENTVSILAENAFAKLKGKEPQRHLSEIASRLKGFREAIVPAKNMLVSDMMNLWGAPDMVERSRRGSQFDDPDLRTINGAIQGRKGEIIRSSFKMADAFDNFFKTLTRGQEWAVESNRAAHVSKNRSPGESIDHATDRIYNEVRRAANNPFANYDLYRKHSAIIKAAHTRSLEDYFQAPLGKLGKAANETVQSLPILELLFPFRKTPMNLLKEGLKRTPFAGAKAIYDWKSGKVTDQAFVDRMVQSAMGTSVFMLAMAAAMNDELEGGGPADPKENQTKRATGWIPYSKKVGDSYVSFSKLAPFSLIVGMGADFGEAMKNNDIDSMSDIMQKFISSGSNLVLDQSMVQGVENTVNLLSDPQGKGKTAVKALEASAVPNAIGLVPFGQLATAADDSYRQTEAFSMSPLIAKIPGLSQSLDPQRLPTGEVRERRGSMAERLLSPFTRSEVKKGAVVDAAKEMERLQLSTNAPPPFFRVGDEKVMYTGEEQEELGQAQMSAMEKIAALSGQGWYERLPDTATLDNPHARTKETVIRSIISRYKNPVTRRIQRDAISRARDKSYGVSEAIFGKDSV